YAAERSTTRPKPPAQVVMMQVVQREADRVSMQEYSPPGVIINEANEILQFRGQLTPYLAPAAGAATMNLFKLIRPEMVADLRYLINAAGRQNAPVKKDQLFLKQDGLQKRFKIRVVPLSVPTHNGERFFSIFFEDTFDSGAEKTSAKDRR